MNFIGLRKRNVNGHITLLMRILLDTGSNLANAALGFLLADTAHTVLVMSDDANIDAPGTAFVPDIIVVGNNFDKTRSLTIFPAVRVVLLKLGLSGRRVRIAMDANRIKCVLPDRMNLSGFMELIDRFEKDRP